jgi:hypothetical protein
MPNYTPEKLLQYLYKETSVKETAAIEAALKNDWALREKLNVLKVSMQRLDKIVQSPRTEIVLRILRHAKTGLKQEA